MLERCPTLQHMLPLNNLHSLTLLLLCSLTFCSSHLEMFVTECMINHTKLDFLCSHAAKQSFPFVNRLNP